MIPNNGARTPYLRQEWAIEEAGFMQLSNPGNHYHTRVLIVIGESLGGILGRYFEHVITHTRILNYGIMIEHGNASLVPAPPLLERASTPVGGSLADHGLELVRSTAQAPFELNGHPLCRAVICECRSSGRVLLGLVVDFKVWDYYSDTVLLKILQRGPGNREEAGRYEVLCADSRLLPGGRREELALYWHKRLSKLNHCRALLPANNRPTLSSVATESVSEIIEPALCSAARKLAHATKVSLSTVLLSVTMRVYSSASGVPHAVVGTNVHARTRATDQVLGPVSQFVLIPLRAPGKDDPCVYLKEMQREVLESYRHMDIPYLDLVHARLGAIPPAFFRPPQELFDFWFEFFPYRPSEAGAPGDLRVEISNLSEGVVDPNSSFNIDDSLRDSWNNDNIALLAYELSDRVIVSLEFNSKIFSATMMTQFLDACLNALFDMCRPWATHLT